jgi:hypothetical protein
MSTGKRNGAPEDAAVIVHLDLTLPLSLGAEVGNSLPQPIHEQEFVGGYNRQRMILIKTGNFVEHHERRIRVYSPYRFHPRPALLAIAPTLSRCPQAPHEQTSPPALWEVRTA